MPRKLTDRQVSILAFVEAHPGTSIDETAKGLGIPYSSAQVGLARLERIERLRVERIRDGGYHRNIYWPLEGPDPDSPDPLERAFAAPAAERDG